MSCIRICYEYISKENIEWKISFFDKKGNMIISYFEDKYGMIFIIIICAKNK